MSLPLFLSQKFCDAKWKESSQFLIPVQHSWDSHELFFSYGKDFALSFAQNQQQNIMHTKQTNKNRTSCCRSQRACVWAMHFTFKLVQSVDMNDMKKWQLHSESVWIFTKQCFRPHSAESHLITGFIIASKMVPREVVDGALSDLIELQMSLFITGELES